MQRRVHVAGINGKKADALAGKFGIPDTAHVTQSGLAGTVCPPAGIGVNGRVAGNVQYDGSSALSRRSGQRPEQRLGESKRSKHVDCQGPLQLFTVSVAKKSKRRRPQV